MTVHAAVSRRSAVWAFIAQWWQQIAITQAGIYLVAGFGASHAILPGPAAWVLAIGMEGTYLKGLVDSGHVRGKGQMWATALIWATYLTVILWGIAYILGLPAVGVIPAAKLGPVWGSVLAGLHVLPIAGTGLCSAMLHRARTAEEAQRRAAREAEAHERQRHNADQLDREAEEERAQRRALTLDQERQAAALGLELREAEGKALVRLRVQAAREAAQPPHSLRTHHPHRARTPQYRAVCARSKNQSCTPACGPHTRRTRGLAVRPWPARRDGRSQWCAR
jgi:hypothetical protein